jgi:ribosomal protein L37E
MELKMAILKSLKRVAVYSVKKSTELLDQVKLNMFINFKEDERSRTFTEMGRNAYASYMSSDSVSRETIEGFCTKIDGLNSEITQLKKRQAKFSNSVTCRSCGSENPKMSVYCSVCGFRLGKIASPDNADDCDNG